MDIAIIGMSGVFPESEDVSELNDNLIQNFNGVKEMPNTRKLHFPNLNLGNVEFGFLKSISSFDYGFFGISKSEADHMDPQQRITLELVCKAIWDAGYSLKDFEYTNTSLILNSPGSPKKEYLDLVSEFHPTLITGNAHSMGVGRISYYLGLQGPSMYIDSSCASSLISIIESCNKLIANEVDIAISGGIKILANLENFINQENFGMESTSQRCNVFDDNADGVIGGEGGGIVILKRLEDAEKDNDNIYATIKGSAINQDGNRSNGMTAPSPIAQTKVISEAWKNANINPEEVNYIEAHGTGTKLGDPIEVKGISDAFKQFTDKKNFCYIGSLKSNIGHLGEASGIASLIKVILQIKSGVMFKTINFNKPNQLIDFQNSPLIVNNKNRRIDNNTSFIAGLSSFALNGTNAHMVIEKYRKNSKKTKEIKNRDYLFTVSGKNQVQLSKYMDKLKQHIIQNKDIEISDLSSTLNKGRDDYEYRLSFISNNLDDICKKLEKYENINKTVPKDLTFVLPDINHIPRKKLHYLKYINKTTSKKYRNLESHFSDIAKCDSTEKFLYLYLTLHLLKSFGLTQKHFIAMGIGSVVIKYYNEDLNIEDIKEILRKKDWDTNIDFEQLNKVIKNLSKENNMFLLLNNGNESINKHFNNGNENVEIIEDNSFDKISELISSLYLKGININWDQYYNDMNSYKISIPSYPFENTEAWIKNPLLNKQKVESNIENNEEIKKEDVAYVLQEIWYKNLEEDNITKNSDFFELGGNSLIAIHIIEEIENYYNITLDDGIIFENPTIDTLSKHVNSIIDSTVGHNEKKSFETKPVIQSNEYSLSHTQESMWYLYNIDKKDTSYNIPYAVKIDGHINNKVFENSINEVIKNNEALRTAFITSDNKSKALIKEHNDLNSPVEFIDLSNFNKTIQKQEIHNIYDDCTFKPFNLSIPPLIRVKLVKTEKDSHVLIIVMHHIISDNWSFQIVLKDILNYYQLLFSGQKDIRSQKIQYQYLINQTLENQNPDIFEEKKNFWKCQLENAPEFIKLPNQYKRPEIQSFNGNYKNFQIDNDIVKSLKNLYPNTSLFLIFLSAFQILLHKLSQDSDIIIGIPLAGRDQKSKDVVGHFVNTLPLRVRGLTTDFSNNLYKNKSNFSELLNNREVSFTQIVELVKKQRSLSYTPIFQILFDYEEDHITRFLDTTGFEIYPLFEKIKSVKGDLELIISNEESNHNGKIIYNTDIFSDDFIENILNDFQKILISISEGISDIKQTLNSEKW
ncbi:condensation domain-containing protein [Staphylococcus xylosus]|uniref:condensation domain-containing protein n=1 Tax=Staphylococcus xylosus TaxID=1288 RepID=UPI003F551FCB